MSTRIHYEGQPFELLAGETVLAGLERQGKKLPSFCRTGVCQTCVVRAARGRPPANSQAGLADSWVERGCFLACQCVPSESLDIEPWDAVGTFESRVVRVERLSPGVLRVKLEAPSGLSYRAGQFIQLERPGGLSRPYSLASTPGSDGLELHVAVRRGGAVSEWLETATGQSLTVRGPFGECFYFDNEPERPLLLAGTGTGLAPLIGITRAALAAGHRAPIHLYHGSSELAGLYLWRDLAGLAEQSPELRVFGSVLSGDVAAAVSTPRCQILAESLDRLILNDPLDFARCRVYLCGGPEVVQRLRQRIYLSGAPRSRIHCDPFVPPATTP
jgi:CDP-4-dehydro-6-deoxyglucose reductase, E3